MKTEIKPGSKVAGYTITELVRKESVFIWCTAQDAKGQKVELQIVPKECGLSVEALDAIEKALKDALKELQSVSRARGLYVPQNIHKNEEFPLVAVYSFVSNQSFREKLLSDPTSAREQWRDACDRVNAAHLKRIVHGHITPESFVVSSGKVYLRDFGYAPLLERKHPDTLKDLGTVVAPEVAKDGKMSEAADIYSFAKTLILWNPALAKKDWYLKATKVDPLDRFARIGDLFSAAEPDLDKAPADSPPAAPPIPGRIKKVFRIRIKISPPEAGDVLGIKTSYAPGEDADLEAQANPGWKFETWTGAASSDRHLTLPVRADHEITANFSRIENVSLVTSARPRGGGIVTAGSEVAMGTVLEVTATPKEGWRFGHWSGDARGNLPRIKVVMDRDQRIYANFERLERFFPRFLRALNSPWVVFPLCAAITLADLIVLDRFGVTNLPPMSRLPALTVGVILILVSLGAFGRRIR